MSARYRGAVQRAARCSVWCISDLLAHVLTCSRAHVLPYERQEAEERQAQRAAMQEDDARHDAVERSRREAEAARRARRAATGQPPQWGGSGPPQGGECWDPAAAWRGSVASAERAAAEVASGLGLAYELAAEKLEGVAAGLRQAAAGAGAGAGAGGRHAPP